MTGYPTDRRYGQWAGDKLGHAEDKTRCVQEVSDPRSYIGHQCLRKRGHGDDGEYCKQHAGRVKSKH